MSNATFTDTGRSAFLEMMIERPLHLAWGSGDPAWDDDSDKKHLQEPLYHKTALENELGRRPISGYFFVTPDPDGSILIPINELEVPEEGIPEEGFSEQEVERYAISETPTPYVHVEAKFDYTDARGQVIRELAIFMNGVPKDDVPKGQLYLTPNDLATTGRLLHVKRLVKPVQRSGSDRHAYEFIIIL